MTVPSQSSQSSPLITRRNVFMGAGALLLCAPAIVRAASLMPVRSLILPTQRPWAGFCERVFYSALAGNLRDGRMRTNLNGKIVPEAEARRLVAYARAQGWIHRYSGSELKYPSAD